MSGVILLAFFLWLFFYIVLGIISTAVLMVVRGEFSDMGEGQWIALLICIWPILLIIGIFYGIIKVTIWLANHMSYHYKEYKRR